MAKARFKSEPTFWSRLVWRLSFVATRAAMPYGIMALSLVYALPGVVVLAAIGANVYWVSLVMKTRRLLRTAEAVAAAYATTAASRFDREPRGGKKPTWVPRLITFARATR